MDDSTAATIDLLWPRPRIAERLPRAFHLPPRPVVAATDDLGRPSRELWRMLEGLGLAPRPGALEDASIRLRLTPGGDAHPESYVLDVGPAGIDLESPTRAGLFYGVCTLGQLLRPFPERLISTGNGDRPAIPGLHVADRPDFAHRGVLLDVSRGKVPTMATLYALIDRLARWKINQLQLYTEHTFAYRGHRTVWGDASPLTAEEIRELDAFCHERFVELVPNQQSCGHFHRWLVHEPYRRLAECPGGVDHPWSREPEPFGLCPTDPAALDFLAELYAELLPNFTSRQLNVDLDETFDLGKGRSADACAERGKTAVYLDFVREVHRLAARHGRRIQLWADVILEHPEHLEELPDDVVALIWGYEHDHPFAEQTEKLAASGREFYVCPGTSSWLSFAGRTTNTLINLASAARHGHAHGASGYLITDWGDCGHLQPLPVSYLGFLAGAGFAWNTAAAREPLAPPWIELLDRYAFDPGTGELGAATLALGDVYHETGTPSFNGSALFHLVVNPRDDLDHGRYRGLDAHTLEATRDALADAVAELPDGDSLARREIAWVAEALRLAVDLGHARLEAGRAVPVDALPAPVRRELAARLSQLIDELQPLWLARYRPGGREESVAWLDDLRRLLAS